MIRAFVTRLVVGFALIWGAVASAGAGEGTTDWQRAQSSDVRLILPTTLKPVDGWVYAGIEVRLPPGAKTYWRTAGDTGVAPTFDFSQSRALGDAEVLFPAPEAFDDGIGGTAYGYHDRVIFPVRFKPLAEQPTLAVQMDYGVCMKAMCVPANASLSAALPATEAKASADVLPGVLSEVPVFVSFGGENSLAFLKATAHTDANSLTLKVSVRAPAGTNFFAEIDDGFTAAKSQQVEGGLMFVTTTQKSAADKAWGKARLTLVAERKAIETLVDLDALLQK